MDAATAAPQRQCTETVRGGMDTAFDTACRHATEGVPAVISRATRSMTESSSRVSCIIVHRDCNPSRTFRRASATRHFTVPTGPRNIWEISA